MLQCKVFMVGKRPPITDFLYYCRQWFFLVNLHEFRVGARPFYGHLHDICRRRHGVMEEIRSRWKRGSYCVDRHTWLYLPGVAERGDEGSQGPERRGGGCRPVPEVLSPLSGPWTAVALPLSRAHPRPPPLPERTHLHSGRRPLPPAAAALTSSSFLLLARDTSCI